MKFALSSYSLSGLVNSGKANEKELIKITKDLGFEGIEFAEIHPPKGADKLSWAKELKEECDRVGLTVTQYSVGADFLYGSDGDFNKEVSRLKDEVLVAATLGASGMRHDATGGFRGEEKKYKGFSDALPVIVKGYKEVTEFAKEKGIKTMIENHGFFCQDSERVEKIVNGVADENFGVQLDIGNFLCVDEDPVTACSRLAPYVSYVHAKDFHIKSGNALPPCDGFFKTRGGNYLRGAIVGHGDVPVLQCLSIVKNAGYDGFVTLEFEGIEEPEKACRFGLNTLKKTDDILK